VAVRSQPVSIRAVQNPTGTTSYRVLGTIRPKEQQRKQHFACLEDAVAAQAAWEAERMGVRAALRPKITRLNVHQLAQAEAAVQVLEGSGMSLIEVVKHAFRNPPRTIIKKKSERSADRISRRATAIRRLLPI